MLLRFTYIRRCETKISFCAVYLCKFYFISRLIILSSLIIHPLIDLLSDVFVYVKDHSQPIQNLENTVTNITILLQPVPHLIPLQLVLLLTLPLMRLPLLVLRNVVTKNF